MSKRTEAAAVVARLDEEYRRSREALHAALKAFMQGGPPPDAAQRRAGAFAYPALRITYATAQPTPRLARAYARFSQPGVYRATITRPELFADYLTEQLTLLMTDFEIEVAVERSDQEIPFPYVLDGADAAVADVGADELARHFPTTELAHIGDEVIDGFWTA